MLIHWLAGLMHSLIKYFLSKSMSLIRFLLQYNATQYSMDIVMYACQNYYYTTFITLFLNLLIFGSYSLSLSVAINLFSSAAKPKWNDEQRMCTANKEWAFIRINQWGGRCIYRKSQLCLYSTPPLRLIH